jgi:hypothetical protein
LDLLAMNSRERIDVAMRLGTPDRVPVMCQLALGHYFLQTRIGAVEIWHSTEGFCEALIELQQRYGFDGILINLPGRDPNWRSYVGRIEQREGESIIHWKNGWHTISPPDDNAHVFRENGRRWFPPFEQIEPGRLFYVEPHDISGVTYPYSWGFSGEEAANGSGFFPPWHFDLIRYVLERTGGRVSVHSEIFSPLSQFMELLDYTNGLLALVDDPEKCEACLDALSEGAIELGRGQAAAGAHAILISSAFAGGGFISRKHYSRFVLPYERKVIRGIRERLDVPIYTHTCGAIGDRLDLMMETGTTGIDTLDPPPLGTVDLAEAKRVLAGRCFIKGNIDPVNVLLRGTPEVVYEDALRRIAIAGPGGGYILSSACSVPPHAPPENIMKLRAAAEAVSSRQ